MTKIPTPPNEWDRARYYLAWAKRQGFTADAIVTRWPKHPNMKINLLDKAKVEVLLDLQK